MDSRDRYSTVVVAALLAVAALAAGTLAACGGGSASAPAGAEDAAPAPAVDGADDASPSLAPSGRQSARPTPASPAHKWEPRLVLTPAEITAVRRRLADGDQPWASAWRHFRDAYVARALEEPVPLEAGPYRGGGDIHDAFLALDAASRRARDLAIAFALTGDETYGRRARDILVRWAAEAEPTRPRDYRSADTGQLQSWGAFSFAYAYDLTRGSGLYSAADERLVEAYFGRFTVALREALDELARDPSVGTDRRRRYEWSDSLTYRFEDRVIGGTFSLAIQNALVALAVQTGDQATLDEVLYDPENPLRADRALRSALRPDNDGDGNLPGPTPQVAILKAHTAARGGTVDYMTYNARLATILAEVTESVDPPIARDARGMLRRSWLYLARFFGDDARPSPNPQDEIDLRACLPRFVPAYEAVRDERLLDVVLWGDEVRYYEPQFLGPVTLTHLPAE